MSTLIDLSTISKALTGLMNIIGALAKNIEKAIKSGIRSGDAIRRASERKRFRNFMVLTAHLYEEQRALTSALGYFVDFGELGDWEEAKFEILTISRLLDKIERYILPANDVLITKYRKEYMEILTSLKDRRRLLDFVYGLEYEDARKHLKALKGIASAYVKLMNELRDVSFGLGALLVDNESLARNPSGGLKELRATESSSKRKGSAKKSESKRKSAAT